MQKIYNIILGTFSIFFGGMIYILWRNDSLIMFSLFDFIGLSYIINLLRTYTIEYNAIFPKWFYFSLPNALWAFGGLLLFYSIWNRNEKEYNIWVGLFIVISVYSELGQLYNIIPGTWDIQDLVFIALAIISAILLNTKLKTRFTNMNRYYKNLLSANLLCLLALLAGGSLADIGYTIGGILGVSFLVVIIFSIIGALFERGKIKNMSSVELKAYERQKEKEELSRLHGEITPEIICPHCQEKGNVHTQKHTKQQGINGAKATMGVFTGGLSLLATGLSDSKMVTKAFCENCQQTWLF